MLSKSIFKAFFLCLGLLLVTIPVLATDNPWNIMINIPEYRLYLYHNSGLFKIYKVAVGKIDSPSPTGEFQIINKVINPTWYPEGRPAIPPGPNNPLGKYWMGLNNKGYGIHGNSAAWSIGAPASKGCFRMDNHQIKELFSIVPVGTPVKVNYCTVKGKIDLDNQAWLEIYSDIYHQFNLEIEVQHVLTKLNWVFQPHQKALACLITVKKPLTIMIPRKIRIDSDWRNMENDGFYWNNQVYLRYDFFARNNPSIIMPDNGLFQGYFLWDPLSRLVGGQQKLEWNKNLNTLTVNQIKVLINGEKIDGAGRFGSERQILINHSIISKWFAKKQLLNPGFVISMPEGNQLAGEYSEGEFWVDPRALIDDFSKFNYQWDEATWTLNLFYIPD